jgi:hypothetical protein
MYVKNDATIDYRIHSGHVGGRWAKGQQVDLVQLDEGSYKLSWTEPAGACVAVNILPAQCRTRHNSLSSAAINSSLARRQHSGTARRRRPMRIEELTSCLGMLTQPAVVTR